jgi:hypothetical protein
MNWPRCFSHLSPESTRFIKRIGVLGAGNVVKTKIIPALEANFHLLEDVIVCSLEPPSQVMWMPYKYLPVENGGLMPLDRLAELGFLANALWIIATPSQYHVHYAMQLAGLCKVAIEKPLASSARQARLLRPFTSQIYIIDHKVFNASPLSLIRRLRNNPSQIEDVARIEGVFYETDGIAKGRQADDTIADIQYHLLAVLQAVLKAADTPFEIKIDKVLTSKYRQDSEGLFQDPFVCTSSLITGLAHRNGRHIQLDLRQVKGAPANQKFIRFFDTSGQVIEEVDMNESGFHAHARIVGSLLQPVIDMRHNYEDSISIMETLEVIPKLVLK